ncbi:phage head closure protein [Cupriavidus basilensis]|uniref:Phage head closure protein n=1 Tax=Cupriavidus basilensis TaxID=68895 RepID=A0ABT6AX00_9BURK|nr:phage head closure protein [Cupriavidus basilensis]MDF3837149.1 phage head closure protein [Cupriavidus basilensis]
MEAGKLNRLITIERRTGDRDLAGGADPGGWVRVAKVWANIQKKSGLETIKSDTPISVVRASIRIRYLTGIDAGMRIRHGSTIYAIKAVVSDEVRRRHVDLVCETGALR